MTRKLWEECQNCPDNYCHNDVSFGLFLTDIERKKFPDINQKFPCKFLLENGNCAIHKERPLDCRLYPFDIIEKNRKFFWFYRKTTCSILLNKNFEPYLVDLEKTVIPKLKKYLKEYSLFRFEELSKKYSLEILREVKL